ncbi:MAG: LysR family transcriptional regulator [Gammaproteobacteria bacterium]|nr:LysR family transcriptional regulator [Gammaproteobacteria bacterium]
MVSVRFRLDFAPGASVGPGKIDLLSAIDAEGSLSAAARSLGMSYRRAWLLLDSLNASFDTPVTTASVGGRGGGGVLLTPFGHELVRHYRKFAREVETLAARRWGRIAARHALPVGAAAARSKGKSPAAGSTPGVTAVARRRHRQS